MAEYGLNDKGEDVLKLQRYLNEVLHLDMKADGSLGKVTQFAIKELQNKLGIVENNEDGPCYGPVTQDKILAIINKKYLNENDFIKASNKLQIETNVIKTVTTVEALQFGFYNNGLPVMLFERHHFYKQLCAAKGVDFANKAAIDFPDICNPSPGGYQGGKHELDRLDRAKSIDETSALLSASYGLFQIMGFNYAQAGYKSVKEYYEAICISEQNQLDAFVNYLMLDKTKSLLNSLKKKDFTAFAKEYNGPAYAKNNYDTKMMKAYQSLSSK
jgi:hypothetical protein